MLKEPGLRKALGHPLLVLGGRCSYGIYVLHFPVALATAWWVWSKGWPAWVTILCGISSSLLLALALHLAVERPMIRLGRRLTTR